MRPAEGTSALDVGRVEQFLSHFRFASRPTFGFLHRLSDLRARRNDPQNESFAVVRVAVLHLHQHLFTLEPAGPPWPAPRVCRAAEAQAIH